MSIFDPDSKFMTFLRVTGDLIILNVIYVICSLPLVTIGAAQAGLYAGLRDLFDRDGDNSTVKSFFKGFKNGFWKITAIWSVILLFMAMLSYSIYFLYQTMKLKIVTTRAPIIFAIVGLAILCVYSAQLMIFHSKFDCTPSLLIKNTLVMIIGFPIRNLIMGIMLYIPVGVFIMDGGITFIRATPLWLAIYYSLYCLLSSSLMKKPFNKIINPDGDEEEKKAGENAAEDSGTNDNNDSEDSNDNNDSKDSNDN